MYHNLGAKRENCLANLLLIELCVKKYLVNTFTDSPSHYPLQRPPWREAAAKGTLLPPWDTIGTVNPKNKDTSYNPMCKLRAILLKKKGGIAEAMWTPVGLNKTSGRRRGIETLQRMGLFHTSHCQDWGF